MSRVLVIDDSRLVLTVMRDALERAGFGVLTELSGEAGLEKLAEFDPDVVVTDLEMPGVAGLEVLRRVHAHSPVIPVLILTEHGEVPLVVQAMREGAFGYLRKGLSDEALVEEINAALKHRAVLEQNRKLQEIARQYQTRLERMVEEKTAEVLELQRRQAQTEKMAALGTLLAGVAHEVNNPLAVIAGNAQWLQECIDEVAGTGDPEAVLKELVRFKQTLSEMGSSADRIERLVARLRRLSHPGSEEGLCDVARALDQVELYCRPHLSGTAELFRTVEPALPPLALSEDDFVSAVSNLVINACHAVVPGSGRIELQARRSPEGARWTQLTVADNGTGIEPKHLSQVWDPFFTTKPPGRGTGLGLSLVYQIVTAAGGEVQIDSVVGRGTTVGLKLPTAERLQV